MNRQSAAALIKDTFNYPFDEGRFRIFIRNLFSDLDETKAFPYLKGQYIKDSFKGRVKRYCRLGTYTDPNGDKVDILVVHLERESALDRARTMQRNFIAWYLKNRGEKDAAVVAYYADGMEDWRFSFVRMEYRQETAESGRIRVREELTPARRYSFLVGKNEPNHTAQEQIIPILQDDRNTPTLKDLEKAFSVETVTRQFYYDYRGLFESLTAELDHILGKDSKIKRDFEKRSVETANFAKKLLGQIVFLYFLQKKGWLGVGKDEEGNLKPWGTGPKNFLRQLFEKQFIDYNNFFNDVLEPLFYDALATERADDFYPHFNCKIPFLNGGLFEPIGGYNWQETDIVIPDNLLKEILDTFDRYNFTVREDEPLEKEVAVDPEMLGRVFENLLPENLRKGQGAYYTPREIVHYMCQESLINYLDTAVNPRKASIVQTPPRQMTLFGELEPVQTTLPLDETTPAIPREDIEEFIRKGEFAVEHDTAKEEGTKSYKYQVSKSIRENAQFLDKKLAAIKICDPAIGSGAFPVGMMHEIVKARNVLTTYLEDKAKRSIYDFKRHCIQESLYGVDIDPGAIEIAKLRLWLSLVVDEEEYQTIKPLPNLDYKIMQGNSLIEEFHGISLNLEKKEEAQQSLFAEDSELDRLIEALHQKQNSFFNATHPQDKKEWKEKVENAIVKIFHYELQRQKEPYFRELTDIEEKASRFPKKEDQQKYYGAEKSKLDKKYNFDFEAVENELREITHGNKTRNFFPWKLYFADVFRNNGGFDVVIANPPYGLLNKKQNQKTGYNVTDEELSFYKRDKEYLPASGGMINVFRLFIVRSIHLLKPNGFFSEIFPLAFVGDLSASKLRKYLLRNHKPVIIEAFPERDNERKRVFEGVKMSVCVLNLVKSNEPKSFGVRIHWDKFVNLANETVAMTREDIKIIDPKNFTIPLLNSKDFELIRKIYANSERLSKYGHCFTGEIDLTFGKKYLTNNPNDSVLIKGAILDRYTVRKSMSQGEIKFLNARYYLEENRGKKVNHHKKHRIVMQAITGVNERIRLKMTLIEENVFCANSVNYLVFENSKTDLRFFLAVLNSRLLNYVFIKSSTNSNVNGYEVDNLPVVVNLSKKEEGHVVNLVDQILSLKKSDPNADTSALEAEIDRMVYELYGLTEEEIAIVEGSIGG